MDAKPVDRLRPSRTADSEPDRAPGGPRKVRNVDRPTSIPCGALRVAMVALSVFSLAACFEGYPTEDVPQIDPARMTRAQLLAALNALGGEPHLGKRWRYALHANCELEVSVRDGDTDRRRVVLEGAEINSRSVDGVTEIRLVPTIGGKTKAVTVLETRKWPDTVRATSLLTYLEIRCGGPAVPGA